jgi:hypothetical protein
MQDSKKRSFPRWLFAILAIGGLVAAGIYLGIISVEGVTSGRLIQAAAFGLLGLTMFWGALHTPR